MTAYEIRIQILIHNIKQMQIQNTLGQGTIQKKSSLEINNNNDFKKY